MLCGYFYIFCRGWLIFRSLHSKGRLRLASLAESSAMTANDMVIKILWRASRLLEEKGWTQRSMARDAKGAACSLNSEEIACYCLSGALVKSWRELDCGKEDFYFQLFESRFYAVLSKSYNHGYMLAQWNDNIATSRESVVDLIHAVIQSFHSEPIKLCDGKPHGDRMQRSDEPHRVRDLPLGCGKSPQMALPAFAALAGPSRLLGPSSQYAAIGRHILARVFVPCFAQAAV
jgi:hypothetical protein